jgi:hypothetical protein
MSSNASSIATLQQIIAAAQRELEILGVDTTTMTTTTKMTKTTKTKTAGDEKPKQKGQMNAWTAYGKEVHSTHAAEFAAWKVEQAAAGIPISKQTMPCFISQWRKNHEEDYKTFEAAWKEAHPKGSAPASSAASIADDESVAGSVESSTSSAKKKRGPKKLVDMTLNERAAHDAKVAAKRAAKEGPAPAEAPLAAPVPVVVVAPVVVAPVPTPVVAAPVPVPAAAPVAESLDDDDDSPVLLAFKHEGVKYRRLGTPTGEGIDWYSNDLWADLKGAKGDYVGELEEDGSINRDADEPELE